MKRFFTSISLIAFVAGISLGAISVGVRADMRGSGVFADVQAGSYYDDAIGEMYAQGIITGYADGRFGPDDPLTRGQIAVIMQRFMEKMGGIASSSSSRSSRSTSASSASSEETAANENGTFQFTVEAFTVTESSPRASVSVVRNGGSKGTARVDYTTADGTAAAGTDYTAGNGTLTFEEGETSQTISVSLRNDEDGESGETFTITLTNPTGGAALGSQKAVTVTVLDNDSSGAASSSSTASVGAQGALTFGAAAYAIDEDAGQLSVTVERTGGTTGQVAVNYATSNGTALSGTNYEASNGTLTFGAGETAKTFTVTITNNTDSKGNKLFNMTLSNPTGGAVLGTTAGAQVVIVDDETIATSTGSIRFVDATMEGTEGEVLQVPVLRTGGTKGTTSVNFTTNNAGAQSGFDYQSTSGTLTFRDGESKKLIPVSILDDTNANESSETFTITLSSPTNGVTLITPSMTTISIFE